MVVCLRLAPAGRATMDVRRTVPAVGGRPMDAVHREYDRFGPWAVEVSEEDPMPRLFEPHVTRREVPLLSLKIRGTSSGATLARAWTSTTTWFPSTATSSSSSHAWTVRCARRHAG